MDKPTIDEVEIRQYASEKSFYRGEEYYENNAVGDVVWRDGVLSAEVYGSHYLPYTIRVTFDERGVVNADCSCPYDWGGWCKHIVAVLLTYVHTPDVIEERPPLQDLLAGLDRDQLEEVLLELAARDEALVNRVEVILASIRPAEQADTASDDAQAAHVEVDPALVRRQVRAIFHQLERMPSSEAYWHVEEMVETVRDLLISAWDLIYQEEGRNAMAMLEAITGEYVEGWYHVDDSDGWASGFFDELAQAWAQACLVADLSDQEREAWAEKLQAWHEELEDYGTGYEFAMAAAAARQGWEYPPLQRTLAGEITPQGAWEGEAPWFADPLAQARLQVLERQERYEEYLNLAQAEGQIRQYVLMLAKIGRGEEAIEQGMRHFERPDHFLPLARELQRQDEVESALSVAEHGLTLDGSKRGLAEWLRDAAAAAGEPELALAAAEILFREELSLASYLRVQELAGEQWEEVREELLEELRSRSSFPYNAGPTEIFLHEGLLDDAITAFEKASGSHYLLERVMGAVVEHRPKWVIRKAKQQAARIIEPGNSAHYDRAVDWLRKARAAYRAAGREQDWQAYLAGVREQHGRKYKLMGLLEEM